MELVYFVLVCFGLTQIIVDSKILAPIRPSFSLFHCSMCMGFWVGMILALGSGFVSIWNYNGLEVFLMGTLGSGSSYMLSLLTKWLSSGKECPLK